MVRQHDAACTYTDIRPPDMTNTDGGRGTRDTCEVVMLGQPKARVPRRFGMLC